MEQTRKTRKITDYIILILGAVYVIGILTFAKACGKTEEGSWMSCHWAQQAVLAFAAVLLVIALLHFILSNNRIKQGLSIASILCAAAAAAVPGILISLCMMDTMRCHSVMRPFTIVMSGLWIIAAFLDILLNLK